MPSDLTLQLVDLSRDLGHPGHDYAILGEGNTSARVDGDAFLVKASGTSLSSLTADGLVRVRFDACREMLEGPDLDDAEITAALEAARADPDATLRPSVETAMHAALLQLDGVAFVGHTHPTAINALTCSEHFERLAERLFPDHVVVCGPSSVMVPYVDPGLPLARAVRDGAASYIGRYGGFPQTIYLRNHGFIALGTTAKQVSQVTAMAVKAARILAGALAAGGAVAMTDAQVARIAGRDDEHYRQRMLAAAAAPERYL